MIFISNLYQTFKPTLMGNCISTKQPSNNRNQNQILTQNRLINHQTTRRNHLQTQVTTPTKAKSESSVLASGHTFTFDISNLRDTDSIFLEILSRLPLKSVFRFKCVCKHWLTIISHSSFPRFYFSRKLTTNTSSLSIRILYKYISGPGIDGVLDSFRPDWSDFVLCLSMRIPRQGFSFKLLAVSNGLILCCSQSGPLIYYVCDPVSRQKFVLPPRNNSYRVENINLFPVSFGQGFVTRVDEHNVLTSYTVVVVSYEMKSPSNYLTLDTFSSETGEWFEYRLPCPKSITLPRLSFGPIVFNGIFHWFVYQHGMVAFDPYKNSKSCRIINFPDDRDVPGENIHDGLYRLCDGCGGNLRFFQVAPDVSSFYCFSMWDMKDYGKGEWCSEFKVTRSDLSSFDPVLDGWLMKATFMPLCFNPLNIDIVYLRCVELACVVSYSIMNRRLDVACKLIGVADDLSWRVVVPFVIPRWPTRVPIPPARKKVITP